MWQNVVQVTWQCRHTCANIHLDAGVDDNRQMSRRTQRMSQNAAVQTDVPWIVGMNGHRDITQHRFKTRRCNDDLIVYSRGYMWNKIISKLFQSSSMSVGSNFISVSGNLPEITYLGFLHLKNIFQHVQCCWNTFEIISELFHRLKLLHVLFHT